MTSLIKRHSVLRESPILLVNGVCYCYRVTVYGMMYHVHVESWEPDGMQQSQKIIYKGRGESLADHIFDNYTKGLELFKEGA